MGAFDNYHATSNLSGVIVSFPTLLDFTYCRSSICPDEGGHFSGIISAIGG